MEKHQATEPAPSTAGEQTRVLNLETAPIGTKAPASGGGYWIRVQRGWKWCTGATFPRPGGDWTGELIAPDALLSAPALPAAALPVGELTEEQIDTIAGGKVDYFDRRVFARAILAAARSQPVPTVPDNMQDWKGMDGAIAFHLIERHADNWSDTGKMMGEWLAANQGSQPVRE